MTTIDWFGRRMFLWKSMLTRTLTLFKWLWLWNVISTGEYYYIEQYADKDIEETIEQCRKCILIPRVRKFMIPWKNIMKHGRKSEYPRLANREWIHTYPLPNCNKYYIVKSVWRVFDESDRKRIMAHIRFTTDDDCVRISVCVYLSRASLLLFWIFIRCHGCCWRVYSAGLIIDWCVYFGAGSAPISFYSRSMRFGGDLMVLLFDGCRKCCRAIYLTRPHYYLLYH